jgi:hypothetical protein
MLAASLVKEQVELVRRGKKTARQAAEELARPCTCRIVNVDRAEELLTRYLKEGEK